MTTNGVVQIVMFFLLILAITKPLGSYMTAVFEAGGRLCIPCASRSSGCVTLLAASRSPSSNAGRSMLRVFLRSASSSVLILYLLLKLQGVLPFNPDGGSARRMRRPAPPR